MRVAHERAASVLVVDDDPIIRRIVGDQLEGCGWSLYFAQDWPSMNEVLFREEIAVILMDVMLPGLEGDVLADVVRRNLKPAPRVLLHSGLGEEELQARAAAAGVDGYVCKGRPTAELRDAIRRAADAWEEDRRRLDAGSTAASPASAPRDREVLRTDPPARQPRPSLRHRRNGNGH